MTDALSVLHDVLGDDDSLSGAGDVDDVWRQ